MNMKLSLSLMRVALPPRRKTGIKALQWTVQKETRECMSPGLNPCKGLGG